MEENRCSMPHGSVLINREITSNIKRILVHLNLFNKHWSVTSKQMPKVDQDNLH